MSYLSPSEARKLILHGQGLLTSPAQKQSVQDIIQHLGYVQLDSINVLERAHHLTLGARWDGYRRPFLKKLFERERALFEDWTHDACLIPIEHEPHWHVRRERFQKSAVANAWWKKRMGTNPVKTQKEIVKRLETEGPLSTSAFRKKGRKRESWWGWTPEKTALEYSWRTGLLAVRGREGFEKVYDLAEKVIPTAPRQPSREETLAWSCRQALQRLGLATTTELANFWYFFRSAELSQWCQDSLPSVSVDGQQYWVRPDFAEVLEKAPDPPRRLRLLCPFDPLVRDRNRLQKFFGFDYRFEAFVPRDKRRYGYYVLPMLVGDRFVGRLDATHHRQEGVLEVLGCWWESRASESALEKELQRLARRIGAERVLSLTKKVSDISG